AVVVPGRGRVSPVGRNRGTGRSGRGVRCFFGRLPRRGVPGGRRRQPVSVLELVHAVVKLASRRRGRPNQLLKRIRALLSWTGGLRSAVAAAAYLLDVRRPEVRMPGIIPIHGLGLIAGLIAADPRWAVPNELPRGWKMADIAAAAGSAGGGRVYV